MADSYESQFQLLHEEVNVFSPQAANKLLQIKAALSARAAFYAAFVIVCLEARGKQSNYRIVSSLTTGDLNNFTYFEFTKGDPQAVSEFSEALAYYQADCKQRFNPLDNNSTAAV
jgi:hypothetical protein